MTTASRTWGARSGDIDPIQPSTGHFVEWMVFTGLMFGYIYNLIFAVAPLATTGRLVLLVLAVAYWRRGIGVGSALIHSFPTFFAVTIAVYLYATVLWISGGDSTLALRAFYLMTYTVAGAVLWTVAARQRNWHVDSLFASAVAVQSLFVIYSLVTPGFRHWLAAVLVPAGNMSLEDSIRPPGLSNSSGASLSIIQGLGAFAALQTGERATGRAQVIWSIAAVLCVLTAALTGRSGLLLAIAGIAIVAFTAAPRYKRSLLGYGIVLSLVTVVGAPLAQTALEQSIPSFDRLSAWAMEFFVSGVNTGSVEALRSQPIPKLDLETVAGTGRTTSPDGGNASGSDAGYIQTYYALGLPMTVLWYAAIFGFLGRMAWQADSRVRLIVLVAALAILEVKEPFTFKWVFPFLLIALCLSSSYQRPVNAEGS